MIAVNLKMPKGTSAYSRAYRAKNREKLSADGKAYYYSHKEERQAYQAKNVERISARQRVYRAANKEKISTQRKERFSVPKNRIFRLVEYAKQRKHVDEGLIGALTTNIPTHCPCCGIEFNWRLGRGQHPAAPSLDRTDNDLEYTVDNTRILCYRCNRLKSFSSLLDAQMLVRYLYEVCNETA